MKTLLFLAAGIFASSTFASDTAMNADSIRASSSAGSHSWSTGGSGTSSNETSFTGHNSTHKVNRDTVQVKDGDLTVNDVSYGKVEKISVVKYSVKGDKKVLTVDGVERRPIK